MRSNRIPTILLSFLTTTGLLGLGQAEAAWQAPHLQGPQDPGYAELIATCSNPPQGRGARGGGGRGRGAGGPGPAARGGAARGGAARGGAAQPADQDYAVAAIPGVIAAGQRWSVVWEGTGNNADGIIGTEDGRLMMAQNDNGAVVVVDASGQLSTAFSDTNTGGALSRSSTGALFLAERGLHAAIRQLEPQRRILADQIQGDALDCIGGVLNDLTADGRGGVYFTMGGLFYADPNGVVTRYGENLNTNGVILSPDERTLYVTNGGTLAAFDVAANGSLSNQREYTLEGGGGGDGLAVDSMGRVYVTGGAGIQVLGPDGTYLGLIPTPRGVITAAFSGPDKKTLFAVANNRQDDLVFSIPMLAEGYAGRAK